MADCLVCFIARWFGWLIFMSGAAQGEGLGELEQGGQLGPYLWLSPSPPPPSLHPRHITHSPPPPHLHCSIFVVALPETGSVVWWQDDLVLWYPVWCITAVPFRSHGAHKELPAKVHLQVLVGGICKFLPWFPGAFRHAEPALPRLVNVLTGRRCRCHPVIWNFGPVCNIRWFLSTRRAWRSTKRETHKHVNTEDHVTWYVTIAILLDSHSSYENALIWHKRQSVPQSVPHILVRIVDSRSTNKFAPWIQDGGHTCPLLALVFGLICNILAFMQANFNWITRVDDEIFWCYSPSRTPRNALETCEATKSSNILDASWAQ